MNNNELRHHGILGQKWGVRRFQNKDGTLTPAGKKRYDGNQNGDEKKKMDKETKRVIGTALTVGGVALATTGAIVASTLISELRVNKEADQAIRKAKGYVAELIMDKNPHVREMAKKRLSELDKMLSQRKSAMNNTNKAFDALNSAARKFR